MAKRKTPFFIFFIFWLSLTALTISALYPKQVKALIRKIYYTFKGSVKDRRHHNLWSYGVRIPANYQVYGIDVSHYQDDIDWQELSKMNIRGIRLQFAFIKATEGATYQDRFFVKNWGEAKQAGLLCGAYHYFKPGVSGKDQAENFIQTVKLEKGDLPPVLDFEVLEGESRKEVISEAKIWLNSVEKAFKIKPIIYSSRNFYREFLQAELSDYPLWVAHYQVPRPGLAENQWLFWQFTEKATVNGVNGSADLNVFNGSWADLNNLTKK